MRCTSEPDKGSTFHLLVPLEVAPDHARATLTNNERKLVRDLGLVIRIDELQQSAAGHSESIEGADTDQGLERKRLTLEDKNILVVEDNWAHQIVTKKRLGMMGCKTKIAVNGGDALTLLKKGAFSPDIILMDIHMPIMVSNLVTEPHEVKLLPDIL